MKKIGQGWQYTVYDLERKDFIEKIFNERKERLEKAGVFSSIEKLFQFYKVNS